MLLVVVFLLGPAAAAGGHHGHSMPGSLVNISRDDRGVQQAALVVAYAFNNQSNDAFLFKPLDVRKAQKQIVKGVRYVVDLDISRTVCRKQISNNDFSHCDFQPVPPLKQTFQCHSDIWVIPWTIQMEVLDLMCEP